MQQMYGGYKHFRRCSISVRERHERRSLREWLYTREWAEWVNKFYHRSINNNNDNKIFIQTTKMSSIELVGLQTNLIVVLV